MNLNHDTEQILNKYETYFSSSQRAVLESRGHAIVEDRREGDYIYDLNGKKYIDCISSLSIHNLGRRPSAVVDELRKAIHDTDQGNFPMISKEKAALAEKISRFVPGKLECTVFSVIRGESIDFACKLARGFTGRQEFLTVDGSWFGQTGFALSLSDRKDREFYGPLIPGIRQLPFGDIESARKMITRKTAAVFIEPVQAENNCRQAGKEYLQVLRSLCTKKGAVLVFDETQSGMGRTGNKFAFEESGVIPDVLVIGESLGAGVFPIAATVFTQRLNKFMNAHPMIHLSTFGGSDIGCRVASKALDEYDRLKPWDNAAGNGKMLRDGLESLKNSFPGKIKSLDGRGLLLSMDFGTSEKALAFCRAAADRGLLVCPGDVARSSIIFRPGLLIGNTTITEILQAVSDALKSI
ncbi:MAG: hypothetical protein CVV44_14455 [Spirochaetae bacterium HGW-Spirochaetae-1]|jgi:acetylornithine/succinyldiaminopimelate/putrescine aminotransferase|nr:MAG: hypothetical protein CVV44_14455 [Spirochaetae bacterium HGW-Spirochaetae-1]